jgi:hypothetical protein
MTLPDLARRGATPVLVATARCRGSQVAAWQGDAVGARARLKDSLEESIRHGDWSQLTASLDTSGDTFCHPGQARAAAVLAGAVETTLAPSVRCKP